MKKSKIPSESEIKEVNELYRSCLACSGELQDAYAEWCRRRDESEAITTLQAKLNKASAEFENFKSRIGAIKFDIEKGEYFPAIGEDGRENFRIKVTRTQTVTLEIASDCAESAISHAEDAISNAKHTDFGPMKYSYEEISR